MPIPEKKPNEDKQKFVARCMGSETMKKEYPDNKQRVAICLGQTRKGKSSLLDNVLEILGFSISYECDECESEGQLLTMDNLVVPNPEDYIDFGEVPEDVDIASLAKYTYKDPMTQELFYFDKKGNYKKNDRYLKFDGEASASDYQGKKVTLNKPFRTPDGPKKFSVYVKNEKGNVVKVNFGDPNMKIKKNIPERRRSFRARHNCDNPGPKWKARYWSCKAW
jgi:hypothetical protein